MDQILWGRTRTETQPVTGQIYSERDTSQTTQKKRKETTTTTTTTKTLPGPSFKEHNENIRHASQMTTKVRHTQDLWDISSAEETQVK